MLYIYIYILYIYIYIYIYIYVYIVYIVCISNIIYIINYKMNIYKPTLIFKSHTLPLIPYVSTYNYVF